MSVCNYTVRSECVVLVNCSAPRDGNSKYTRRRFRGRKAAYGVERKSDATRNLIFSEEIYRATKRATWTCMCADGHVPRLCLYVWHMKTRFSVLFCAAGYISLLLYAVVVCGVVHAF